MRKLYGNDVSFENVLIKVRFLHLLNICDHMMYAQGVLSQPEGLKAFYDKLNALVGPVNKYNSGAVFKIQDAV